MNNNTEQTNKTLPESGLPLGPSESPFEAAATMFGLYAPKFELHLKEMSTGELRRLINALVQYPLNEKEFINDSQRLRTGFALGQALLEAKWVMLTHAFMEQEQARLRENEENQTTNEEIKEQANG
jgi:hypothetical protein